jgi:uncharacterized protein (TIGR02001 family)
MKILRLAALLASASMLAASTAFAADEVVTQEEIASKFDIAFGVAVTTQYVSRGVPQSDGFALQGYVEASYDWAYVGIWASNVGPTGFLPDTVEYDIYGGIRPTFGNLTLDLGYAHYFYNATGSCCGEVYLKPTYAFTDSFSAGLEIYYSPTFDVFSYGEINATVGLPYDFSLSAALGTDFVGGINWNAGVSYTFADTVTADLRYHGHNDPVIGDRIVATLSVDTTLRTLMGR